MDRINIFVIDDHKLFVNGLCMLLSDENKFNVVGHAFSALDFFSRTQADNVDVYLVDINMPKISGYEVARRIKTENPGSKVLALTMYDDYDYIEKMVQNGADGYVLKSASIQELSTAIVLIAAGNKFFGNEIQDILFKKIGGRSVVVENKTSENYGNTKLTKREIEILVLIAKEYTTQQIAEKLFISERTVETHRKNIFSKTEAKSVIGLSKYALNHGIISYEH